MSIETIVECVRTASSIRRWAEHARNGMNDPDPAEYLRLTFKHLDEEFARGAMSLPSIGEILSQLAQLPGYSAAGVEFSGRNYLCWLEAAQSFVYATDERQALRFAYDSAGNCDLFETKNWSRENWLELAQQIEPPCSIDALIRGAKFELAAIKDPRVMKATVSPALGRQQALTSSADELVSQPDVAAALYTSPQNITNLRSRHEDFPQIVQVLDRMNWYHKAEIIAWCSAHKRRCAWKVK